MENYDLVIFGGGIFGSYGALFFARKGLRVCLVEREAELMQKASVVNQARLHSGYHYPRSITTAQTANDFKKRFIDDHQPFINATFKQYYAIDKYGSFTDAKSFERFCRFIGIKAEKVRSLPFLNPKRIEAIYITEEYSFDPIMIREYYMEQLRHQKGLVILTDIAPSHAEQQANHWIVSLKTPRAQEMVIRTPCVINATYANINTINTLFNIPPLHLVYELTEMAFIASPPLKDIGLTIMDGHYCSIMPYGKADLLSLSSVTYTPHHTSKDQYPAFPCQAQTASCTPQAIAICNLCQQCPGSNAHKMINQMYHYIDNQIPLRYIFSMFTVKTKLESSYIDDGRPTVIAKCSDKPFFYCVFAGKINCIYEIETVLDHV